MEQDSKIKSKIAKTYAEDMAKVIEDDKSGLVKKIIQGEEKHEIEKMNLSPESKRNKLFMLVGLLCILLGLITLFFYIPAKKDNSVIPVEKQFTPLIFNDKSVFFEVKDLKKEEIAQTVFNAVNATKVKDGGVEGIYLTYDKKVMGLRKFIALIKGSFQPKADQSADNVFVSDNFLMGVVNAETKDFFILLKVRSLPDVFDSLRLWENKMFLDLHGFFGIDISSETNYLLTAEFKDSIVGNKNARILFDNDNKIVMMYVLANDTSVIITNTENAAQEIMLRLASSRVKK